MDVKRLLSVRSKTKSSKPRFIRQKAGHKVEVGTKYRKPRGYHSKMRLGHKGKGLMPSAGYRSPSLIRGTNPDGLKEILIYSVADLEKVTKTDCAVIASSVGRRNRIQILEKAIELKVNISVNAKEELSRLKKEFEDSKKLRSDKKTSRVKVEAKKAKKAKKVVTENKEDVKEDSNEDADKKKQEKILINKEKAM